MTRPSRILSATSIGRGLAEVALIFIGITLAIGFENWNSEREERRVERELLEEVRLNLIDNQFKLDTLIIGTIDLVTSMEHLATVLETGAAFDEEASFALGRLDNWGSPFFVTSAWETLRERGLTIVEDPQLRRELVTVYEATFAFLVGDVDRYRWDRHQSVIYPLTAEHVTEVIDSTNRVVGVPIDEARLRADPRILAAARTKATSARRIMELFVDASSETSRMIDRLADVVGAEPPRPPSVLESPESAARVETFRSELPVQWNGDAAGGG